NSFSRVPWRVARHSCIVPIGLVHHKDLEHSSPPAVTVYSRPVRSSLPLTDQTVCVGGWVANGTPVAACLRHAPGHSGMARSRRGATMSRNGGAGVDFFVSHAGPDRAWAEWVAWQLVEAGYTVELDSWDWAAGENTIARIRDALEGAGRVIALLSRAYFED